jgi:hypothetical protein
VEGEVGTGREEVEGESELTTIVEETTCRGFETAEVILEVTRAAAAMCEVHRRVAVWCSVAERIRDGAVAIWPGRRHKTFEGLKGKEKRPKTRRSSN